MNPLVKGDWDDVRQLAATLAKPLASESCEIGAASGRVMAGEVRSLVDLPSAEVSAMDGWAVAGAGPWALRGRVTNGHPSTVRLGAGEAIGIGTGGAVPHGATAIVRREHGTEDGAVIRWTPPAGSVLSLRDVRPQGEEIGRGELLLPAGTRLDPVSIALASGCGHDALEVVCAPQVDLLVTGDEIVLRGVPAAGLIRDSVGPLLGGMVRGAGGVVARTIAVRDDLALLAERIEASQADVIITSGSTAVGDADHLREALQVLGASIVIDRMAVRPGSPTMLAVLPDGRLVAGLPGNPLAAVVGFMAVVAPVLGALTGARGIVRRRETLGVDLEPDDRGTRVVPFVRVDGRAVPTGWSASSMLRGLATSDGLLVVPRGTASQGDEVDVVEPLWRSAPPPFR